MILDEIIEHKRAEVAAQKINVPLAALMEQIERVEPPRDFRGALRQEGVSLIAEIKRASPSKGDIMPDVNAVELAGVYEQSGARAISVLTDAKYFKGSLSDLTEVHNHVRIPCLRKEFVVDPYQIYEARAAGADAILLIIRVLSDAEIKEFQGIAKKLGMAALVETHTLEEIMRAKEAGAHIIGINNRDLDTLTVDVKVTLELRKRVPGGVTLVSESGIYTRAHVKALEDGGVDGILVGESLLTSRDIRGKIWELLGRDEG
ncbi:MAG TPA: indole-3-glycerol phosphate synthase TrpC [Candidatus Hydrogenedentes bacterium]|nr:indole-3-glycerol phosphate synthase TrpC [Candidatus Hydrogenedentota bacterium]